MKQQIFYDIIYLAIQFNIYNNLMNDSNLKCYNFMSLHQIIGKQIVVVCFVLLFLIQISYCQSCPSSGPDFKTNYVSNGDFEDPSLGGATYQQYPGGINGWATTLGELGVGSYFNTNWGSTQVLHLDTGSNQNYTQSFNAPAGIQLYFIVDYAVFMGQLPSSCNMRIYFNGKNEAQNPAANTYNILNLQVNLTSIAGLNTLAIYGMGTQDHYGTTIDNVRLAPIVTYNRQIINGVCSCSPGYFDNGFNTECLPCDLLLTNCGTCTYVVDTAQVTANCNTSPLNSGANCLYGTFQCLTCTSGYFFTGTACQTIQQTPPNFYESSWKLTYKACNHFTAQFQILLPDYASLTQVKLNNTNVTLVSKQFTKSSIADVYMFQIQAEYTGDIAEEVVSFVVFYNTLSAGTANQASMIKMSASDMPLIYYTQGQCSTIKGVEEFVLAIGIISYFVLFISLISLKIVGLELFGVLQLAFFSLSNQDGINAYLKPMLAWKYLNGLNFQTSSEMNNVSTSVNLMRYNDNFFSNINFMYAILLLDLILGFIFQKIAKRLSNKKLYKISKYMLKKIFITLFLFNSFNLSFSMGIHFQYAREQSTSNYGIGTVGALSGIFIHIYAVMVMQFTKQDQFGEFKLKFKKNCVNKFYIPLSIMYRFILGLYLAVQNEWYLGSLIVIAFSFAFILYNLVNLPFIDTYQNYRANMCHVIQLIILFVSNFYRSMKYNLPLAEKARINGPAILEIAAIFICMIVSLACLSYECYHIIKDFLQRRKLKQQNPSLDASQQIIKQPQLSTVLDQKKTTTPINQVNLTDTEIIDSPRINN